MTLSDIQNDTADETSDNDENLLVNASIFEMQINDLQTLIDECICSVYDVDLLRIPLLKMILIVKLHQQKTKSMNLMMICLILKVKTL